MAKKQSLCADIEAAMLLKAPWYERIGDEAFAELKALRERFRSGAICSKHHLIARLAIEAGEARGWTMPSEKVLATWLRSND